MNIITGYRGEPHITSYQDRAQNQGSFGTGMYILDVGNKLSAEIISANEVRIKDGALSMQGCVANIAKGMYDSCAIDNGTQGMQRRDLIVARYTKDAGTNVEDVSLVVIKGTPASSSPATPSYNSGDIQQGDSPVDMPLYMVNISGITISSVTLIASTVSTQAEIDTTLGYLIDYVETTNAPYGLTMTVRRNKAVQNLVQIIIRGTTNQTLSTSSGYILLQRASSWAPFINNGILKNINFNATYVGQLTIGSDGSINIGYTKQMGAPSNSDIPSNTSIYINETILLY